MILQDFNGCLHSLINGFSVQAYQVTVSRRDAFGKSLVHIFQRNDRFHLKICTHHCHVINFRITNLRGNIDSINLEDYDVFSSRGMDHTVWIVDESNSRL